MAQRFGAESFTLANGLQVVVIPNHRAPAVTQMVWYKTGAADDPRGKSGIAHFLEHLMFKGTRANPGSAFSALIAQNGGRDNAFTTEDYTVFHETVAKDRLTWSCGSRPTGWPAWCSTMPRYCPSATSSSKSAACASTTSRARCCASS
jgi:hypothetical protein